jgi:hypothetical protein
MRGLEQGELQLLDIQLIKNHPVLTPPKNEGV